MPGSSVQHRVKKVGPNEFAETKVWEIPKSPRFPQGYKFAFTYYRERGEEQGRIYGVDNAHGFGPHEHFEGERRPIRETSWESALDYFWRRVREIRDRTAGEHPVD